MYTLQCHGRRHHITIPKEIVTSLGIIPGTKFYIIINERENIELVSEDKTPPRFIPDQR